MRVVYQPREENEVSSNPSLIRMVGAGIGAFTTIVAEPFFPAPVAVIWVDPSANPVTSPTWLTDAMPESALLHASVIPGMA